MALSPALLQVFKDIGQASLAVVVKELVPALEAEVNVLFPNEAAMLTAGESLVNPAVQQALASLAAQVEF